MSFILSPSPTFRRNGPIDDDGMKTNNRMIVFTRYPEAGRVKRRLIGTLGPEGAADLQRRMTEFTLTQAQKSGARLEIRFCGATIEQMRAWLGNAHTYVDQGPGDLGQRMARAFDEHFVRGAGKVVLIGSDCPDNRAANLTTCFGLLENHACVIGPARDGGYYLIGLNRPQPQVFNAIAWGSNSVLRQTLSAIRGRVKLLPTLTDVDRPEDVPKRISVIIPALDEEDHIGRAVQGARTGFDVECRVVDGGSLDATARVAARAGARVHASEPGRARQLNLGARLAKGEILLFLHADCQLPPNFDVLVRRALRRPGVVLGSFRFKITERGFGLRLVEIGTLLRSKLLRLPYGDQGFFITRNHFDALGGYPDVPILEDFLLVKQARKKGTLIQVATPLITSGRRWTRLGVLKTTLLNQMVLLAAARGADLGGLHLAYRQGRIPLWSFSKK